MNLVGPIVIFFEKILLYLYDFISNIGLSDIAPGLSIITLTVLVRLLLLPLNIKQEKSMKNMKKIQPEVEKLKEEYKDKPEDLNKATMELYKKYNVNPLGGCLPLLLQLPILWGLFGVFTTRNNHEVVIPLNDFLWFNLETPDKILPFLIGAIMLIQQKLVNSLNPTQSANKQMEMMSISMSIMFVFISYKFPGALQLYWFTSTLIGFIIQYFIMKSRND